MHGLRRKVFLIKDKNGYCVVPQSALYFNCGKGCGTVNNSKSAKPVGIKPRVCYTERKDVTYDMNIDTLYLL